MGSKSASHGKTRVRPAAVTEFRGPVGGQVERIQGDEVRGEPELDGHQQHTAMPWGVARGTAETILTSIGEGFFALDADGRFTYINPQAESVIQHSAQDVLGRVIWDVLPREMTSAVQGPYERARIHRVVASFEGQCPNRKNWIAGRMQPNRAGGLGVYLRDVTTERRMQLELHESDERFSATFEQALIGIAHVAARGQWLRVNQRLCEILGFSRDVLLAQTFEGQCVWPISR